MRWTGWLASPARPTDCHECRELAEENGGAPDCQACGKPREQSRQNAEAWQAWLSLDGYGRNHDGMNGFLLPLRTEAVEVECARHADPEGVRWRVLDIERAMLAARREQATSKAK